MSKINIFNYEAHYLELIEGTISIENKALLLDFLSKNPQLVEPEFDFVLPKLNVDSSSKFKESLKIHDESEIISEYNVEWFIWAKMEEILSSSSSVRLKKYLDQHPDLYRLVVDFYETKLPKKQFVFENKKSLKKGKKVAIWPFISSVAAAILVIFLVGNWMETGANSNPNSNENPKTALKEQKKSEKQNQESVVVEENTSISSNKIPTVAVANLSSNKEKITTKTENNFTINKNSSGEIKIPEIEQENSIEDSLIAEVTVVENDNNIEIPAVEAPTNEEKTAEKTTSESTNVKEEHPTSPATTSQRKFRFGIGKFGIRRK